MIVYALLEKITDEHILFTNISHDVGGERFYGKPSYKEPEFTPFFLLRGIQCFHFLNPVTLFTVILHG